MPCAPVLRFGDRAEVCKSEAGEVMSGILEIVRGSSLTSSLCQSPNLNRARQPADGRLSSESQRVFVRIYRTSSEHFAVIYPIRAIVAACRPLASLNLRSCSVKTLSSSGREFRVSPRSCEGVSLTFRVLETSGQVQLSDWLGAFSDGGQTAKKDACRRKVSEQRSPMPVLEEGEEDETPEACLRG